MTEDAQSRRQGDGPSSEGAEPTEPIAAQTPETHPGGSVTPPAPHIPAQRIAGDSHAIVPPAAPRADSDLHPRAPAPASAPADSDPHSSVPVTASSDPRPPESPPAGTEPPPGEGSPGEMPLPVDDGDGRPQPAGGIHRPGYGEDSPYSISGVPVSPPLSGAPYGTDPYAFDQPIYRPGAPDPGPPANSSFRSAGPPASGDPAHVPYRRSGPSSANDPAHVQN